MAELDLDHTSPDDMRQIDIVKIYNTKKVLVIDDFPEIRGSLKRSLRTFGAQSVETAANGEEAIKLCSNKKFDIVISDYNLGAGKDGQQVLEEVRHLRVLLMTSLFVMLTGESSREMVLGALECQPDDYITKPYTEQSLRTRLNRAIIRHEALLPIKTAISDGDYKVAVERCNEVINAGSRYAKDVIKMKAQLLFLLRYLKDAQDIYENVLEKKPLAWAKIGLGKTFLEQGKLDAAEELFEEIITDDERYIEAHDMLAEVYTRRNDMISAQKATERATSISPKSVKRHRQLAELADVNGDDQVSLKSHQNAIKWGNNSCHESPQDYFNYVRKVADVTDGDKSPESKTLVKQANSYLDRARKRYSNKPDVEAQSLMVESQLEKSQGEMETAQKTLQKAKDSYSKLHLPSTNTSLEFARSLYAMEEEDQARAILNSLAAKHPDDKKLMRVIDGITSEPVSDDGKDVATKLTRSGISAYDKKDFDSAIAVFNDAIAAYPKHVGLNLNLVQAILAQSEALGPNDKSAKMCLRSMRIVGEIKPEDKQFKRFAFIQKQLSKIYPDVMTKLQ